MGSGARAIVAMVVVVLVFMMLRFLIRRVKPLVTAAIKTFFALGSVVLLVGLALMLPTKLAMTFGSPVAMAIAVAVALALAVCLFWVYGVLGVVGGAITGAKFGLVQYLAWFLGVGFLSAFLAQLGIGPVSRVSPLIWGGLIAVSLAFFAAALFTGWRARIARAGPLLLEK